MTMPAARSAIMSVGEFVLPDVMVGMIEASITRRRSMPRTLNLASTTAVGSLSRPILHVPTGWKIVVPTLPAACDQLVVGLEGRAGHEFLGLVLLHRLGAGHDAAREAQRGDRGPPVLVGGEVVGRDRRIVLRIAAI